MIEDVITYTNDALQTGFSNAAVHGLCQSVIISHGKTVKKSYPAFVDLNGEGTYPFLDDKFDIGWYHRLLNKRYLPVKGTGRKDDLILEFEGTLIVWGFTKKLQMSAYETEEKMVGLLPAGVVAVRSIFDSLTVFNSEFRGFRFPVRPEEFVLSITYRVRQRLVDC